MFKCVLISLFEVRFFISLKNESVLFWTRVHFKGGVKFFKTHKEGQGGGGHQTDLDFFFWGGGLWPSGGHYGML